MAGGNVVPPYAEREPADLPPRQSHIDAIVGGHVLEGSLAKEIGRNPVIVTESRIEFPMRRQIQPRL